MSVAERLDRIEKDIRATFPDVNMKIGWQRLSRHAELWVYVLDAPRFDEVESRCLAMGNEEIATQRPAIWIVPQLWDRPWPGTDPEVERQKLERLEAQREDFRRRHNMVRSSAR